MHTFCNGDVDVNENKLGGGEKGKGLLERRGDFAISSTRPTPISLTAVPYLDVLQCLPMGWDDPSNYLLPRCLKGADLATESLQEGGDSGCIDRSRSR